MVIVAFEGVDGTGKSTSISFVSKFLSEKGIPHLVTQELSGGKMQDRFRQLLIQSETPLDELLAISMARRWHYLNVLEPAIREGKHILMDRFIESTWAYQGQTLNPSLLWFFEKEIWKVPYPNFTVYFAGKCLREIPMDRFERKGADFFKKAKEIYESRANMMKLCSELEQSPRSPWMIVEVAQQAEINSAVLSAINASA